VNCGVKPQALAVLTINKTLPRWVPRWAGLPVMDKASKS
jgi:hypothetical protein